ncbi:adenylate kinase [Actinoplanes sp. NPDC051411]|uniref:adenylate kinase n=1 Tax=Actinoplanes sp. NPDC051411 TaxID=3155522 RepID=UPI003436A205
MRLLMLGPPGSGKGTHGVRLADDYGVVHISSGDVLRAAIAGDTRLAGYVARGDLVPDDVLFKLLVPIMERAVAKTGGFIADGFPRTLAQAERAYREIGIDRHLKLDAVVSLDVPDDVLVRRMLDRAQQQGRADDTLEVIQHRLAVYCAETYPLIEYFRERGILLPVNGNQPPDDVYADIKEALDQRVTK